MIIGNQRVLVGGDIILAIDGRDVVDRNGLQEYLQLNTRVGETVTLSLLRGQAPLEIQVTLGAES